MDVSVLMGQVYCGDPISIRPAPMWRSRLNWAKSKVENLLLQGLDRLLLKWCQGELSRLRPPDFQTGTLPSELPWHFHGHRTLGNPVWNGPWRLRNRKYAVMACLSIWFEAKFARVLISELLRCGLSLAFLFESLKRSTLLIFIIVGIATPESQGGDDDKKPS